jgi:hypothetical protein
MISFPGPPLSVQRFNFYFHFEVNANLMMGVGEWPCRKYFLTVSQCTRKVTAPTRKPDS